MFVEVIRALGCAVLMFLLFYLVVVIAFVL